MLLIIIIIIIIIFTQDEFYSWYYLPNRSARAGYDTRSIF